MERIAFVFPGQGAQYPGMGRALYQNVPAARTVFDTAEGIRPGTKRCCWEENAGLDVTVNTQPCLLCASVAAAYALMERGVKPAMTAGFSAGEMAALHISGLLSFEDAFRLTCLRASAMHREAQKEPSGMAVVLGLANELIEEIAARHPGVYPVNYNCPGQTVVSGRTEPLDRACEAFVAAGGRVRPLKVSGGFHSPLMKGAAAKIKKAVADITFQTPVIPLYANVTAGVYDDPARLIERQITSPVLWQRTVENMAAAGATAFVELGPGKVLTGLIRKTLPHARLYHAQDPDSVQKTADEIGGVTV